MPNGGKTASSGSDAGGITGAAGTGAAGTGAKPTCEGDSRFVHPGALHTQPDIDRIKAGIAAKAEPYHGAWTAFQRSVPSASRQPNPQTMLTDANNSSSLYALQNDGHAAYLLAVHWMISGSEPHAQGAAATLRAWAGSLQGGAPNATLRTGLGMIQMINAAEILRHANGGYAGFTAADVQAFIRMLGDAAVPIFRSAWPRTGFGDAGWGTPSVAAMLAAAIFADDCAWLAEALREFRTGECHSVQALIINDGSAYVGQNAESGRDQGHVQGTVAHLCETAEMAWNQNVDLYAEGDDVLLKAMEYNARYNLGGDVPYRAFGTCNQTYGTLSAAGRGVLSPVYEMVWNHYQNRRQKAAPYTGMARASYAPEASNSDHGGLGTLLYYRP